MKKTLACILILLQFFVTLPAIAKSHGSGPVHVRGHYRKNGSYVRPHYRTQPNRSVSDNWSTRGNRNPYTGKPGTRNPNATQGGTLSRSTIEQIVNSSGIPKIGEAPAEPTMIQREFDQQDYKNEIEAKRQMEERLVSPESQDKKLEPQKIILTPKQKKIEDEAWGSPQVVPLPIQETLTPTVNFDVNSRNVLAQRRRNGQTNKRNLKKRYRR